MSVSDAEFDLWLAGERKDAVWRLEIEHITEITGAPATRTLRFCKSPSGQYVDPEGNIYDDLIDTLPTFAQAIDSRSLGGRVSASFGIATFKNGDGRMNGYVGLAVDGSPVTLKLGAESWASADFRVMFAGLAAKWTTRDKRVELTIEDAARQLGFTIGGEFTTVVGAVEPAIAPLPLGAIHNAKLQLTSVSPDLIYAYAAPPSVACVQTLEALREGGNPLTDWTDNGDGTVTLTASPTLELTGDVLRNALFDIPLGGTRESATASDLIYYLCHLAAPLGTKSINYYGPHSSYEVAGANDAHIGELVTEATPVGDVIGRIMDSVNAFWGHRRDGSLQIGRILPSAPVGAAVIDLTDDDAIGDAEIDRLDPGYAWVNCLVDKNWTQQTAFAGVLTDIERAPYESAGRAFTGTDPVAQAATDYATAPWRYHQSMKPSPLIETRISTLDGNSIANDEAANFATTRFKQFLPWVCLYRRTFRFKAWRLELGDVVNLTDTDNAIDAVRAQVISRSTDHDKEQVELILAYRQPAYVPSPREAILLTFAEIEIPA